MQCFISYRLPLDFPLGLDLEIFDFQKVIIYENGNKLVKYELLTDLSYYESFSLLKTCSYQRGFQPYFSFIHSLFALRESLAIVASFNF
jgi:hypothetical protein